jgi:hypothetical protein
MLQAAECLLAARRRALSLAESAHKAARTEETLAEMMRARRLHHLGLIRLYRARKP